MGKSFIEERKFPIKMEKLSSIIKSVSFSKYLNIKFLSEKALYAGVRYEFKHGFSLKSWGEKIVIKLNKIDENNVSAEISSSCNQLVDYGKNENNVKAIFAYFEKQFLPFNAANGEMGNIAEDQLKQLKILKEMLDNDLISQDEFEQKKKKILGL